MSTHIILIAAAKAADGTGREEPEFGAAAKAARGIEDERVL